jgi:5-carboxymethyl-2-hydroxymuconate isomerase
MPHFVIDCSENIITLRAPEEIMKTVHDLAESTGLFAQGDIKVRVNPYKYYNVGNTQNDFIHVFAYIMEGRNTAQKADLSKRIITALKEMFPAVPVISMNIKDFEKATYCNRTMV